MSQTQLTKVILEKADAIRLKHSAEVLHASHIAAAVAEFCRSQYTGLEFSHYGHPPFEEERLRYLFAKEVRLADYFRLRVSRNAKAGLSEEEFDFAACEHLTDSRPLSADVLFVCALKQLHPSYRTNLRTQDTDVLALLQDAEENVYDYAIENLEKICAELQKKAQEARAIRDWKPAEKFAEPEELATLFFDKIEKTVSGNVLTLKFPRFFGTTDLKVSIHQAQGDYYIHDNGCAVKHLSKQVKDPQKRRRILKKVCSSARMEQGRVTDRFYHVNQFLGYLQQLIFVAQADLYYTKAQVQLCRKDTGYSYVNQDKAEPFDTEALLEQLKTGISFCYDENRGLYYWLDLRYCLSSTRCAFLVETLEKGRIRISDARKGQLEGQILEQFYWDHDDPAQYGKFIGKVADRFGGEFDGRDVYLTEKSGNCYQAMVKFFNLAVILSELGHDLAVPKKKR